MKLDADVVIVGAGFGGSLAAAGMCRAGLNVVLLERFAHPRLTLGESSSALANLILEDLAAQWDLPQLARLSRYGSWCQHHPQVDRGLKRGFAFFGHRPETPFRPNPDHSNELLVGASPGDAVGDTHWNRADFDLFMLNTALQTGAKYYDHVQVGDLSESSNGWSIHGHRFDDHIHIDTQFVIDASGAGAVLARALNIDTTPWHLHTASAGIYGHFYDVNRWDPLYEEFGGCRMDHPFLCDGAALHHIFDEGWMWVLRFDSGLTSAGFMLSPDAIHDNAWSHMMARYPSIARQFCRARLHASYPQVRRTPRLQRCAERMAGPRWAMLPAAAACIDALFSTGNAHTLFRIERLVDTLTQYWGSADLPAALQDYESGLQREIAFIDRLVHSCYRALPQFDAFAACTMLYFCAATWSEERRRTGLTTADDLFLSAGEPGLWQAVMTTHDHDIPDLAAGRICAEQLAHLVTERIRPYNRVGLCDPNRMNMYPYI
jgi:FADH2 O2-dependent halogenase